ncbi:MAG: anhydro-N-acetylmuramic acid kinase [Candidatus Obscuribacterales bacterium]|nr:anhydro-N-acetylmuramic acid kinase [Candidatus Obscuribacterales bacterium]
MKKMNVLGLNSGTSMDGIDAAVFSIEPLSAYDNGGPPRLAASEVVSLLVPYEPQFRRRLSTLVNSGNASLKEICLLNTAIGKVFAEAALQAIRLARKAGEEVDLIGSHGQTIWHEPVQTSFWGIDTSASLQLGDAAVVVAETGLPAVSDFRANDLAVGGQGAPLVSFADEVLFGGTGRALGILNLGGIANLTVLSQSGEAVFAYDTGPGNMLIDRAMESYFD